MRNFKLKFGNGLALDAHKDVKLFEKMAKKGYALISVNSWGFYKFRASEPEECAYSIDFSDIEDKDEGFRHYAEIFAAGGWEYVMSHCSIHYFKAPKGTPPIYSDGESKAEKYENMKKTCIQGFISFGIAAIVLFVIGELVLTRSLSIIFSSVGGGLGGIAIVMLWGIVKNRKVAARLRDGNESYEDCN